MRGTAGKGKIQLHRATFTNPKITYKALEWQPAGLKSTIERIRRRIVLYGHQQLESIKQAASSTGGRRYMYEDSYLGWLIAARARAKNADDVCFFPSS